MNRIDYIDYIYLLYLQIVESRVLFDGQPAATGDAGGHFTVDVGVGADVVGVESGRLLDGTRWHRRPPTDADADAAGDADATAATGIVVAAGVGLVARDQPGKGQQNGMKKSLFLVVFFCTI